MTIASIAPSAGTRQAETARGLIAAAAFLETNPDLPLGNSDPLHYDVFAATDEAARAEVDRIAVILGVEPGYTDRERTHYEAVRDFGGGITYTVIAIDGAAMDRWHALMSYQGTVQPQTGTAA